MTREDIRMLTGCVTNPDNRTRILMIIEPGSDYLHSVTQGTGSFISNTPREGR